MADSAKAASGVTESATGVGLVADSLRRLGIEVVRAHQAEIWRYLRFLGCENGHAEEIAQETFLAVLRKPPPEMPPRACRAYLRKVARNLFLARLRKAKRRPEAELDLDMAEAVWAEAHAGLTGDGGGNDRLAALDGCLEQLEGRAKTAIERTYRENRSRGEIAAELDMTEDGVKSLLRRTRDALRQCVERKTKT